MEADEDPEVIDLVDDFHPHHFSTFRPEIAWNCGGQPTSIYLGFGSYTQHRMDELKIGPQWESPEELLVRDWHGDMVDARRKPVPCDIPPIRKRRNRKTGTLEWIVFGD